MCNILISPGWCNILIKTAAILHDSCLGYCHACVEFYSASFFVDLPTLVTSFLSQNLTKDNDIDTVENIGRVKIDNESTI